MADLYGELTTDNSIKHFYVAPDFGAAGSNQLLISGVGRDKANDYIILKLVDGASGYKYKWTGSAIAERTDTEIKASLLWMEQKKEQLDSQATQDISDLGENRLHSLAVKHTLNQINSGPAVSAAEKTDMQDFDDSRDSIRTTFHSAAESSGFSRLKSASTASNSADVDVKKPDAFAVDDLVTIVDYSDGKRETEKITAINSNTITFENPLTNSTKYKKKKSWVFKAQ